MGLIDTFKQRYKYYRGFAHQSAVYKPPVDPGNPKSLIKNQPVINLPRQGKNGR